jgi:undecaprenyl-diphosphatase
VIVTGRRAALRHPWRIVALAVFAGAVSWVVAVQEPVPAWELAITARANRVPAWGATALVPAMQVGTLAAPVLVALVIVVVRRDLLLAAGVAVGGWLVWLGAKVVKEAVERGRPAAFDPGIVVREPSADGFGYISGHSAVSMFTMVVVAALVPARWRPVAVGVAVVVGCARMVHGVHLPADVVGGWAFGALGAVALLALVGVEDPGEAVAPSTTP